MSDQLGVRTAARGAVVRPLSRATARPCSRPGCPAPSGSTMSFRYDTREAWVDVLSEEAAPETYDLCQAHADRTRPPFGWRLVDQRRGVEVAPDGPAEDLGGDETLAVLAAALHDEPSRAQRPAPSGPSPVLGTTDAPAPAGEEPQPPSPPPGPSAPRAPAAATTSSSVEQPPVGRPPLACRDPEGSSAATPSGADRIRAALIDLAGSAPAVPGSDEDLHQAMAELERRLDVAPGAARAAVQLPLGTEAEDGVYLGDLAPIVDSLR